MCWRISGQPVSSQWPRLSLCTCVSNQAEFVLCQCFPQLFCFISCLPSMHGIHYSRQIFEAFFFFNHLSQGTTFKSTSDSPAIIISVSVPLLLLPFFFLKFSQFLFWSSHLCFSLLCLISSILSSSTQLFSPLLSSPFLLDFKAHTCACTCREHVQYGM